jgi:thiamine pyrophosphokinase
LYIKFEISSPRKHYYADFHLSGLYLQAHQDRHWSQSLGLQALIFANGDINDGAMVRRALDEASSPLVIAADNGALMAEFFGLAPHLVVGDMDSISPDDLARLASSGIEIEQHPVHKNETDLELALMRAVERGADWIRVIGGIGDRLDQTLSNVYLLALPILRDADVSLVAARSETRLLMPGESVLHGEAGDTVSLIPLSGVARGVKTEELFYPLHDEDLPFGPARGVSNVMNAAAAKVCFREGVLLMVHTIGRA